MNQNRVAWICRLLMISLLFLSFQVARAGMIGTEQAVPVAATQAERAQIQGLLARGEVADQLQALGVDLKMAQERVAAMTDDEVRSLAGTIESARAGADISSGWWWVIGIATVAALWWWWTTQKR